MFLPLGFSIPLSFLAATSPLRASEPARVTIQLKWVYLRWPLQAAAHSEAEEWRVVGGRESRRAQRRTPAAAARSTSIGALMATGASCTPEGFLTSRLANLSRAELRCESLGPNALFSLRDSPFFPWRSVAAGEASASTSVLHEQSCTELYTMTMRHSDARTCATARRCG